MHIPPRGSQFLRDSFSGEGLSVLKRLAPIYLCVAGFWCLFDQTASAWVIQAKQMDLDWLDEGLDSYVRSLREDPLLPWASRLTEAELKDHHSTLVSDFAAALFVLED